MLLTFLLALTLTTPCCTRDLAAPEINGTLDFATSEIDNALEAAGLSSRTGDITIKVTGDGEPERFILRFNGGKAVIEGTDGNGALYGALEMAERIRRLGEAAWEGGPVTGTPYLRERGLNVFLTLPWDYEKNNTDYDPAALTDPERWWFHNEGYWRFLLDHMARCRLNWLDLHGTWDVSVTNAPNLYAYFIQSDTYPEIGVTPGIKAANLARLNRVIEMAHHRGIRVSLMAYEAKIRIPQNPDPPYEETEALAYDYTREVVEGMIREAPGLDAIGFRIGESGRGGEFFNCYLEAVERSGRDIPLVTRSWVTRKAKVVPLARGASDFTVEIKYNGEHWAAPYLIAGGRAAGWYSYSFEDYLSDSGEEPARRMWPGHPTAGGGQWPDQPYKIVWQVRANGTHRIFPFFEPDWVRRSVRAMKIGTASGFTVEPFNAYYPASPRYYQADPEDRHGDWIVERDVLYLMQWGRLGYDPDTADAVFDAALEERYGDAAAGGLLADAWMAASRVIPTAFCAYSLGPDHRSHAPELEWGGGSYNFIVDEPFDSHAFMSMKEAFALRATGGRDGRIRPWEAARILNGLSDRIRHGLGSYAPPAELLPVGKHVKELWTVLKMLGHLADYYDHRFDSAYYKAMAEAAPVRSDDRTTPARPGDRMAYDLMRDALDAWTALSESEEAAYYRPFTERLRMGSNTFHWRNELPKVRAETERLAVSEGPRVEAEHPCEEPAPDGAVLAWRMDGNDVVCAIPAAGLKEAWLLEKPLPSSTFFHKTPMTREGDRFEARFPRENRGHLIAAEVAFGFDLRRIPRWDKGDPYLVIPSRPGPTPAFYSSEEAMDYLDEKILDPGKHGMLLLCSRAWNFHRNFQVPVQRKLLDAVERGMTLMVLQQDFTSGRYPLAWLPVRPGVTNRSETVFEPDGALGLERIEAPNIIWQPFTATPGWTVFGNGGVAMAEHGKGKIWMVQARLMQNMHIPACARALVRLLEAGGREKPVVVVDAGTEGAHYATSVFTDLMNAHDIPFLTLGEVIAAEQGVYCFKKVPGRPWEDLVLMGDGPKIMKAFLEKKVKDRAARPAPKSREAWEAEQVRLRKEFLRCLALDPLPPRTPLNAKVTGVLQRKGYRIEKVVFESRVNFPVTAHLYIPDEETGDAVEGDTDGAHGDKTDGTSGSKSVKKLPVILNPHGHWAHKKAEPEVQSRLIFQVLRGYLVMAVDSPGYSFEGDALIERRWAGTHFDLRLILGAGNATAIYTWDLMRALDYLETRPEADMSRVGITGTSGGGLATFATFPVEERIQCAVPVCYATSLDFNIYNGCNCNHVPGMLQVGDRAHVLALRAPCPILVIGADDDVEFPPEGTRRTGEKLKEIWALYGKEADAEWRIFHGEHGYSREMREAMMGFFDKHLKGEGDGSPVAEPALALEPKESRELLCLPDPPEKTLTMRDVAVANLARATAKPFVEVIALNGGLPERVPLSVNLAKDINPLEPQRAAKNPVMITFTSETGLTIPGLLHFPEGEIRAGVVLVSERGKGAAFKTFPVQELLEKGFACLAVDVRGFGELQGLDPGLMAYLGTGDPFAMGWDAARAAQVLLRFTPKVAVVGRGSCGAQIAMFAALMEPMVSFVAGLSGIREYADCFRDDVPTYAIQPRALYGAPLSHLRSLVKQPAVWTFMGEEEPDLVKKLEKLGTLD